MDAPPGNGRRGISSRASDAPRAWQCATSERLTTTDAYGSLIARRRSACPSIAHACLIGDQRPHIAALIVLQPPELAHEHQARSQVEQAISHINADLDPRQQIKSHAILSEPWSPGDELTETLKLRRQHILDKYEHTINQLYGRPTVTTKRQA
jgi:long-subunit acyl-CoA synthetase (AMP-forming)